MTTSGRNHPLGKIITDNGIRNQEKFQIIFLTYQLAPDRPREAARRGPVQRRKVGSGLLRGAEVCVTLRAGRKGRTQGYPNPQSNPKGSSEGLTPVRLTVARQAFNGHTRRRGTGANGAWMGAPEDGVHARIDAGLEAVEEDDATGRVAMGYRTPKIRADSGEDPTADVAGAVTPLRATCRIAHFQGAAFYWIDPAQAGRSRISSKDPGRLSVPNRLPAGRRLPITNIAADARSPHQTNVRVADPTDRAGSTSFLSGPERSLTADAKREISG